MKKWLTILGVGILASCSCEDEAAAEYDMMTRYGGWEARKDEIKADVDQVRNSMVDLIRYDFDSIDYTVFQSPNPYWEQIQVYLDENKGIRAARLLPQQGHEQLREEFFYSDGHLEYAKASNMRIDPDTTLREFFFIENKLVHCYNHKGDKLALDDTSVKLASVDLMNEANQIKTIISQKEIEL